MYKLLILFICLITLGCHRGYKNEKGPLAPEEVALADHAQAIEDRAETLSDSYRANTVLREFASRASRFHNSCRRFGCNSIEARAAFDQLYFQGGEVDKNLENQRDSELARAWSDLRDNYLVAMARKLGYKPGEQ
jgi:hypothetical protein